METITKSLEDEMIEVVKNTSLSHIAIIMDGNDLNDYDAMLLAGTKCAPKDAEKEILEIADWVSTKNGGDGVIRELFRVISLLEE